jgi:hypothetical protein
VPAVLGAAVPGAAAVPAAGVTPGVPAPGLPGTDPLTAGVVPAVPLVPGVAGVPGMLPTGQVGVAAGSASKQGRCRQEQSTVVSCAARFAAN